MTFSFLYRGVIFYIDGGGKASRHKHSKGLYHDACSPIPLISLDQIPMTTMLSEASSDKTYFDSSHSSAVLFIATPPQWHLHHLRKKVTSLNLPVENEISYNQP